MHLQKEFYLQFRIYIWNNLARFSFRLQLKFLEHRIYGFVNQSFFVILCYEEIFNY